MDYEIYLNSLNIDISFNVYSILLYITFHGIAGECQPFIHEGLLIKIFE